MKFLTKTKYRETDSSIEHLSLWRKGEVENIRIVNAGDLKFCCDEMIHAFGTAIIFGEVDGMNLNKSRRVNILQCNPYPEGASYTEYPISFCPFCQEPIEVVEQGEMWPGVSKEEVAKQFEQSLD